MAAAYGSGDGVRESSGRVFGAGAGYIARANALEDNVTIYHTIKGRRTEKKRTTMKVAKREWHTLRVDVKGNRFIVMFDGKKAIEWTDDTFQDAGKVGVWTKADSVTLFDDFSYGRSIFQSKNDPESR